jgi:hypothetical protein
VYIAYVHKQRDAHEDEHHFIYFSVAMGKEKVETLTERGSLLKQVSSAEEDSQMSSP